MMHNPWEDIIEKKIFLSPGVFCDKSVSSISNDFIRITIGFASLEDQKRARVFQRIVEFLVLELKVIREKA